MRKLVKVLWTIAKWYTILQVLEAAFIGFVCCLEERISMINKNDKEPESPKDALRKCNEIVINKLQYSFGVIKKMMD